MSQSPPGFHLRIPPELKERIRISGESRGKSLTKEMLERLERTFEPDEAMQLADAIRPFMDKLTARQRKDAIAAVALLLDLAILAKKRAKK